MAGSGSISAATTSRLAPAALAHGRPLDRESADFCVAHQGRTMIVNRSRAESDVWLLTLAE